MLALVFLLVACLWARQPLAANSTTVEGWQFNDNSRSTWDILWTCFSTIFACTWTILHGDVPARNKSNVRIGIKKSYRWFLALMAPEVIAWIAAEELWQARSTTARCNAAQVARDQETEEPTRWLYQETKPLGQVHDHENLRPVHKKWTLAQGFCLIMGGVALQTEDGWTYTVKPANIQALIKLGVIRCSDFGDREIDDRAKADAFAKGFTILQSTWVVINVLGRIAYKLPIPLIELAVVAYVACGLIAYAFWWHKPKDMTTPIVLSLRYTKDNLPQEIRSITDAASKNWIHVRAIPPKQNIFSTPKIVRAAHRQFLIKIFQEPNTPTRGFSASEEAALDTFAVLSAMFFCGIHLGAWNFLFPTPAERIAWRVFSLVALSMVCVMYIVGEVTPFARWLAKRVKSPSYLKHIADPTKPPGKIETYLSLGAMLFYLLARFGILALTLSSLRALPVGSYTSIDWLASIPHLR